VIDVRGRVPALLDALPNPAAEIELRHQVAREAYRGGRCDGWREGYDAAMREMTQWWTEVARPASRGGIITHQELEVRRWGSGGREHFSDPGPGDYAPYARDRRRQHEP
jgi:hypothetical protein